MNIENKNQPVDEQKNILIKELLEKVKDTQMTEEEYRYISSFLGDINFLVFGTGYDSDLWRYCNRNGKTYFLEHDEAWIKPNSADVLKVSYSTNLTQAKELLEKYNQGDDSGITMEIPSIIKETNWDVIFVDSPPGGGPHMPGRMQSIYAAYKLSMPNSIVFIHDCDREVEDMYSKFFFKIKKQLTKLRELSI